MLMVTLKENLKDVFKHFEPTVGLSEAEERGRLLGWGRLIGHLRYIIIIITELNDRVTSTIVQTTKSSLIHCLKEKEWLYRL